MFDKDSFHHAYFIEGDKEKVLAEIEAFLKDSFGMTRQGNPDVSYEEHASFGIDESRELQARQSLRPITGDMKVFILAVDSITNEAQNSLLKAFEEPTPGAHFFIVSSSERILLPTLRSRMLVVRHSSGKSASLSKRASEFLSASIKDRLALVAEIIETKDKSLAEAFLLSLVSELRGKGLEEASPKRAETIKEILSLTRFLKDRAPSVKLILERVALLHF